jgi:MoaA/NifB/PqqE/SkfB family radical SAM enzyme
MVITKNNLDCIGFVLDTAKKFGIRTIFQPVFDYSHSSGEEAITDLTPDMNRYNAVIDMLIEEKRRGAPIVHSMTYLQYIKNFDRKDKRRCWAGRLYCAITPSGNVAPCFPLIAGRKWPNGIEMGFKKAMQPISSFPCGGCYCLSVEQDSFFDLRPEAVYNTLTELG